MKKKGVIIVISALVLALVAVSLIFILRSPKTEFITKTRSQVTEMGITNNPTTKPKKIVTKNQSQISDIFNIIQETKDTKINRTPNHADSLQQDVKFRIEISYSDGTLDLIQGTKSPYGIFRTLNSKGPQGDPGFIYGENEKLWKYIENIKEIN